MLIPTRAVIFTMFPHITRTFTVCCVDTAALDLLSPRSFGVHCLYSIPFSSSVFLQDFRLILCRCYGFGLSSYDDAYFTSCCVDTFLPWTTYIRRFLAVCWLSCTLDCLLRSAGPQDTKTICLYQYIYFTYLRCLTCCGFWLLCIQLVISITKAPDNMLLQRIPSFSKDKLISWRPLRYCT